MAHKMKISGTNSEFDGEWEFELAQRFSIPEWRIIKKVSGYLPNNWLDGLDGNDYDLWEALAMIALVRAGRVNAKQALLIQDILDAGECLFVAGDEPGDAGPPVEPQPNSPSSDGPPTGQSTSSGSDSPSGSGTVTSESGAL